MRHSLWCRAGGSNVPLCRIRRPVSTATSQWLEENHAAWALHCVVALWQVGFACVFRRCKGIGAWAGRADIVSISITGMNAAQNSDR